MTESEEPSGFLAFRKDDGGDVTGFAVLADKDALSKWRSGNDVGSDASHAGSNAGVASGRSEEPVSLAKGAIKLLDRFKKSMTSVHRMIDFTAAIAPGMTRVFIEQRLLQHARKHLYLAEDTDSVLVYKFYRKDFSTMNGLINSFDEIKQGYNAGRRR